MSGFVFPPPPPPPPKANSDGVTSSAQYSSSRVRGDFRGRGRGSGFRGRGRGRGGFEGSVNSPAGSVNYASTQNGNPRYQNNARQYNVQAGQYSGINGDDSRKRQWTGGQNIQRGYQQKPHPAKRPKVEVAPSVPSFGFSLPVPSASAGLTVSSPVVSTVVKKEKPKPKINQLGLTPQSNVREESEEEEDIDEEAAFAAKGLPANLRVEYKGKVYELGTAEGLKTWLEERKKNWPTKAKIEEKNQEIAKRPSSIRPDKRQRPKEEMQQNSSAKSANETKSEKLKRQLEQHLAKAEKLQRKLQKHVPERETAEAPKEHEQQVTTIIAEPEHEDIKPKIDVETEALGLQSPNSASPTSKSNADSSEGPSMSETDSDSGSGSDVSSMDSDSNSEASSAESPEESSSKIEDSTSSKIPNREPSRRLCREFSIKGRCKYANRCHFKHENPARQASRSAVPRRKETLASKRKTLYQRLVEQEQRIEDQLALQAIKYLGQKGLLKE